MAHWKVMNEKTLKEVDRFKDLEGAENYIAEREEIEPDFVHSGGYGIDGPCPDKGETIINEGGDEITGK